MEDRTNAQKRKSFEAKWINVTITKGVIIIEGSIKMVNNGERIVTRE